jgi:hypothetical protein
MSELNVSNAPQGKGMAVTGFILSLVGLIFGWIVYGIITASAIASAALGQKSGMGLGYFWIVLCIASVVLSAMGMMKLGKTGGKKGLGIAGLIIGIIALIWTIMMHIGVGAAVDAANGAGSGMLQDAMEEAMQNR